MSSSEHPFSAKVGSKYYSYARGFQETVEVNDPSRPNYEPSSRFGHCASLVEDRWFLFGGVSCPLSFIEIYDVCRQEWHQHAAGGDIPEASFGMACTAMQEKIYVFGGRTMDRKYSNALHELDINDMTWKRLEPGNVSNAPMLKADAAMVTHNKCLVTFGGHGIIHKHMKGSRGAAYEGKKEVHTNELIKYDLDKKSWMFPKVCGAAPRPCTGCTLTPVGGGRVVLLGGMGKGGKCVTSLENVKMLDMSAPVWNWITLSSPSGRPAPVPRYGHCVVDLHPLLFNAVMMLWGRGDSETIECIDDAWLLQVNEDLNNCLWSEVSIPVSLCKPAFQSTIELLVSPERKQLIRFGGIVNDRTSPKDDTHLMNIACGSDGTIEVTSSRTTSATRDSGCVEDEEQLKFLGQSQSVELTASKDGSEVDMRNIGFNMSIPPGAIPCDDPLLFTARPVAGGHINMPADCVAHSPLYLLPSLQMQENVKITIDHNCNIESQEDCDSMVFLGVVDQSQGNIKLEEVQDVVVDFQIGNQKGCIYLKNVQSLRVGRKVSPQAEEVTVDKTMYSALWFGNPFPTTPHSIGIFIVSQLQPAFIECAKKEILERHPELNEIVQQQPVYFSSNEVKLQVGTVEGWTVNSNMLQTIYRDSVDLPDKRDITGLDYPPQILVRVTCNMTAHSQGRHVCSVEVLGLDRNLTFELVVENTELPPFSPLANSLSPATDLLSPSSTSSHDSLTSPRTYSPDTMLTIADINLLYKVMGEAFTRWRQIGLNLNLTYHEVEAIRKNPAFLQEGVEVLFLEMLAKWLSSPGKKYVHHLQTALQEDEYQNLASELVERLNSKCRTCSFSPVAAGYSEQQVQDSFGHTIEGLAEFEAAYKLVKFGDDIKEAAKQLRTCTEQWQDNELLKVAMDVSILVEKIQLSLGKSKEMLEVISTIKEKCQELIKVALKHYDCQLKETMGEVEIFSHQLASLASSQLSTKFKVTEDESMQLLLQNVQNLSAAIQSLLNTAASASLQGHKERQSHSLVWKVSEHQAGMIRTSSIANAKSKLEKEGLITALQGKYYPRHGTL